MMQKERRVMAWTQEKINEVYEMIQKKAVTDEEFREELLANTREAIEKIAGEALPEGFQLKVIENDPAYAATFVLPPMASSELDENDLEEVAGGGFEFCSADGCGEHACAANADVKLFKK